MTPALLGTKMGMTRIYDAKGVLVPVTIIQAGPCVVTQVKKSDGPDKYNAVQIAFGDVRAKRSDQATIKRCAIAGVGPKRHFREVRLDEASDQTVGAPVDVKIFEGVSHVDVIGTSKGKGFAGVMKRHHFGGMSASHGTERMHRHGGSIASHATWRGQCGKPKRGLRMPGRMGGDRVTTIGHEVLSIDLENNMLVIKGALPGANGSLLFIEKSRKAKEADGK